MIRPTVILVAVALIAQPALGDEQYKTTIATTKGSPVQLNACEVWARDWNKTATVIHVSIPNYYIDVGVNFTNTSAKKLKDVQFGFTAFDAFGSVLSTIHLAVSQDVSADSVSMDPGATIDLMGPKGWHGDNSKSAKDHIVCSVQKVAFDDGSVWVAPSPGPAISPAP